jgi:hypothetical protein
MEPGAHLEKARDTATHLYYPTGGRGDPGKDFQKCRFAGTVAADDSHSLALLHVKAHILQSPETSSPTEPALFSDCRPGINFASQLRPTALDVPIEAAIVDDAEVVLLRKVFDTNCELHPDSYTTSMKVLSL